jgi:hypothetical protein
MSSETLKNNFEKYSQVDFYVGLLRNKDVRVFNILAAKNDPGMIGISSFVNYIEVENSIDFAFRIGKINIKDCTDFRKNFSLTGNEILYLEYNNISSGLVGPQFHKKGFFRIIGMKESSDGMVGDDKSAKFKQRNLTIFLAEYPYFDILTFNRSKMTYSWDGGNDLLPPIGAKPISLIVNDLFTSTSSREKITNMGITFMSDPSSDILPWDWINYYSPSWSNLKNINFLKRLCTTLVGDYSYYYLNCEDNTIKFRSAYSEYLFLGRKLNKLELIPAELYNLLPMFDISPEDVSNTLIDVDYDFGNTIDATFGGFSGETNFSFDYLSGHVFSAHDYRLFKQLVSSNDLFYLNFNKFGDQHSNMSYSAFTSPKINNNIQKYNYAKRSFNSMVAHATTFVNNGRFLGQLAHIITPNMTKDNPNFIDPILGENWCVWGYRDIVVAQRGITRLTLKKDSTWVSNFGIGGLMLNI